MSASENPVLPAGSLGLDDHEIHVLPLFLAEGHHRLRTPMSIPRSSRATSNEAARPTAAG